MKKPPPKPPLRQPSGAQSHPHPQHPPENENLVVYLSVIVFAAIFGVLLALVYYYQQQQKLPGSDQSYTKMGTMRFQLNDFSMRATLALQSGNDDLEWMNKNRNAVQQFLEESLKNTKPATLTSSKPEKLQQLQNELTEELNKKFPQAHVQQVLFTEFLTSHDAQ